MSHCQILLNTSNAVTVTSETTALTLKPQFGGLSLEATTTLRPHGRNGGRSGDLAANAGQMWFCASIS